MQWGGAGLATPGACAALQNAAESALRVHVLGELGERECGGAPAPDRWTMSRAPQRSYYVRARGCDAPAMRPSADFFWNRQVIRSVQKGLQLVRDSIFIAMPADDSTFDCRAELRGLYARLDGEH
jgi:hypothetical protein